MAQFKFMQMLYIPHADVSMWIQMKQELKELGIPISTHIINLVRQDVERRNHGKRTASFGIPKRSKRNGQVGESERD